MNSSFLRNHRGMTLVEALIVLSIISVLSVSIFSIINGGIKIWMRALDIRNDEDVRIFFDKVRGDLRNIVIFSKMEFDGGSDRISFPCLSFVPGDGWAGMYEIRSVTYGFANNKNMVFREESDLSQVSKKTPGNIKYLLRDVTGMEIEYFVSTDDNEKLVAKSLLNGKGLPRFVKIELTLGNSNSSERKLSELIEIPMTNEVRQ